MKFSWQLKRFFRFYQENGMMNMIQRIRVIFVRHFFQNKTILFYFDLVELKENDCPLPVNYEIERKKNKSDLSEEDLNTFMAQRGKYCGAEKVKSQIEVRFKKKAQFWLIRKNEQFAGFLWSIRNGYVAPFFIPLTLNDVVLFDIETFPEFRGAGINPLLMKYTFHELKKEGVARVYITVKVWNSSSIRAMEKTGFKRIGIAKKFKIFGHDITMWYKK